MPLKLQILSEKGFMWVGWCRHKLEQYRAIRKSGVMIKQTFALPNNVFAQIVCTDICDIIRLWGGTVSGFICHARSDSFPGGMTPDGKQIMPVYAYPLIDNDHGSTVLTSDGKSSPSWTVSRDAENYGNIDRIGADGTVVSWRGPASRSFAMNSLVDYPGFTIIDYVVEETGVIHYTPYQNLVYQGGDVLFEFPITSKVLGATGTYVILGVDYAGRINPDGGTNGFFTEVWRGNTKRIGWLSDSRPDVPWFFDSLGIHAVSSGKQLTINPQNDTIAFSVLPGGSGTLTTNIDGHAWSIAKSGSWTSYRDYAGDTLKDISLNLQTSESSNYVSSGGETFTDLPVMFSGSFSGTITVEGPDAYGGPGAYSYTLHDISGICDFDHEEWNYPTGCGMGTVSVNVHFLGGHVLTGTMQVRMPIGQWSSYVPIYGPFGSYGGAIHESISGGTKTKQSMGNGFNITYNLVDYQMPCEGCGGCGHCITCDLCGTYYYSLGGIDYTWPPYDTPTVVSPAEPNCCGGVATNGFTAFSYTYSIEISQWTC